MDNFYCELCDKKFNKIFNYNRHMRSKRHIININIIKNDLKPQKTPINPEPFQKNPYLTPKTPDKPQIFEEISNNNSNTVCIYCIKKFTKRCHMLRHEKTCKEKIQYEKEVKEEKDNKYKLELELKEKELEKIKNEIIEKTLEEKTKKLEETNEKLQKELEELKNEKKEDRDTYRNTLKYISTTFPNAPSIKYDGYTITEDEIRMMMSVGPVEGMTKLLENKYIKGISKSKRCTWCTDMSRVKYLVKKDINEGTLIKSKWLLETYGESILHPFIDDAVNQISKYFVKKYGNSNIKTPLELFDMNRLSDLSVKLNDHAIQKQIMHYAASKFTLEAYIDQIDDT